MSRTPRRKSSTQTYHVMLRGINKQQIFYDEEDYAYFIKLLDRFKAPCDYKLLAYCLMGNHVHLMIQEGNESIGNVFKHIGSAFVYWYNMKYERIGHLFQDRFRSEPVEDEAYFLTVFRYILMNPVNAGLCHRPEDYPYSSAGEYFMSTAGITDTFIIRSLPIAESLEEYVNQPNEDQCMDMDETIHKRYTDDKARQLILPIIGVLMDNMEKTKDRTVLNASIRRLIHTGISIRQLSRLTGIPKKMIENALK